MKTKQVGKKTLALIAGMFTSLALVVSAPFAFGQPGAPAPAVGAGNIDFTQKGTINIHKYANPDNTAQPVPDGTEVSPIPEGAKPVANVVFTYAKLQDIDLKTNAGWAKIKGLKVDADGTVKDATQQTVATGKEEKFTPTSLQGLTTKSNLELGVYLIKENFAPYTVTKPAAPFLVVLPYVADDAWQYTVHAYPKNTVVTKADQPVKTITKKPHFPGDKITWTINQRVPKLAQGETLTTFRITDQIPTHVEKIDSNNVTVEVKRGGAPQEEITATKQVTPENLVTISFAPNILDKIKSGDEVVVTIIGTIKGDVEGNVDNQANTTFNNKTFPSTDDPHQNPGDPLIGTPTKLAFAPLTINKKNKQQEPLTGAEFKVWPAKGQACEDPAEGAFRLVTTKTDAGQAVLQVVPGDYCVQETKAPVGYDIAEQYKTAQAVTVPKTDGKTLDVVNLRVQETGTDLLPKLPLTGAAGAVLLSLVGTAITAIALGYGFVVLRRRSNEQ
ncbi:SpaH/EbpB family LPXTG-anchored major pilin [Arcanobacterium hippocoleae]|uniref:SpaH/EbpB family LPXTG-anchored major pilin n=1 Tax=Arcanobacterium hippocoleae TaxID=149017 RepID=UPI0033421F1C